MRTNHRRGFVAKSSTDSAMYSALVRDILSDKCFGATMGNDFSKGNRGMAKSKRGLKKFLRSRLRFHANAETKKLAALNKK